MQIPTNSTTGAPLPGARLCHRDTLFQDGSPTSGLSLQGSRSSFDMFFVRDGDSVLGYLNRCPHVGLQLDWWVLQTSGTGRYR